MTRMRQLILNLIAVVALAVSTSPARAFSMLGPFTPWQTSALGYSLVATDPGGPMDIGRTIA